MSEKRTMNRESDATMHRKARVVWLRLNCLKPNPDRSHQTRRYADYSAAVALDGISRLPTNGLSTGYRTRSPGVGMSGQPNPRYSATPMNFRIAYGARAPGRRSLHSSLRTGKPSTWRREAGVSMCQGLGGTRDA